MEQQYTSGMGKESVVPEEIKGWSWGAFLLNWIWGIANSTYIALLMFVPLVNFVMLFVLGAKGNEWAWKNRTWRDVEHFKSTQRKWRNAGLILIFVIMPLLFVPLLTAMKGEAYDLSINAIEENDAVTRMVGEDFEPRFFVMGSITYDGTGGSANLNYTIDGELGSAEVYVYATKLGANWELKEVLVVSTSSDNKVHIVNKTE